MKNPSCGGEPWPSITLPSSAAEVFQDYRLRVGEVVLDTAPPTGLPIVERRLDETEVGEAKFMTLTEVQPSREGQAASPATLPDRLLLDRAASDLVDYDLFASIYNKGKSALLASWRHRRSAERFEPELFAGVSIRHRVVRVVRDYGMFDRRESPQYYPAIGSKIAPRHRES